MSGTLAAALRREFSSSSRHRGEHYFRVGRVTIVRVDEAHLEASVRGSRTYRVGLRLDGDLLRVDCTCPFFVSSYEPCKHLWAVVLTADARRVFTPTGDLDLDISEPVWEEPSVIEDGRDDDAVARLAGYDELLTGTRGGRTSGGAAVLDYWRQRERGRSRTKPKKPPAWQTFLARVQPPDAEPPPVRPLPAGELIYVFDPARSARAGGGMHIELLTRGRKKLGGWMKPKPLSLMRHQIVSLPDADDRWLLESICGALPSYAAWDYGGGMMSVTPSLVLSHGLQQALVPRLCATGRFLLRPAPPAGAPPDEQHLVPIDWDADVAAFELRIAGDATAGYTVTGTLGRAGVTHALADLLFLGHGLVLWKTPDSDAPPRFAALDMRGGDRWLTSIVHAGSVTVPGAQAASLIEALAQTGVSPAECPPELVVETIAAPPRRIVRIARPRVQTHRGGARLDVQLTFAYGDREVDAAAPDRVLIDLERRQARRRDRVAEDEAAARLFALGARRVMSWRNDGPHRGFDMPVKALPSLVRALIAEGWHVEAEGRVHRTPGAVTLEVRSGVDWFELHGSIDFGGISAGLPTLLAALRRGDRFITLDDGSVGQLPEEWLSRSGWIGEIGAPEADHVRFSRSQAALLDAWVGQQPDVWCDETFARARQELASFAGIVPIDPPATFTGVLREYQRDALGWFAFLRQFGFGGCLADEMGLGKTVMVLAALEARRLENHASSTADRRPSLIVVPRSLVFNWQEEARRFAPALHLVDCSGADRHERFAHLHQADVVLTTYGTLRRDIDRLREIPFDYVILDEAQAVKNARTDAAAAVRMLQARHRLALSGTPVENHLGELWSLFDFLNPGLLGGAGLRVSPGSSRTVDDEQVKVLAQGLRPFILRRTKEQVAPELPTRTEQTLYCDLDARQRTVYNELRAHYRETLLQRVTRQGIARSKIYVLEALLRLRQAACHPGLIDRKRADEPSAKLDALVPRLLELAEDGRKVLVFSQFTSLLTLLRPRLDDVGLVYAYLDGRTRDRAARVKQFEEDGCPVFLISLKAGGVGLNLTAAEYVFLLDPWWNPAVEAQAIDRTHRIGQTKPVFAYRLIARDTVEEKVLELQTTKRRLAEAIVRADESLIRTLRREDLDLLLS